MTSGYRVTIPKAIRQKISLQPGQKIAVTAENYYLILIPLRSRATHSNCPS